MDPNSEPHSAVSDTPSIPLDFLSLYQQHRQLTPLQGMSLAGWGNRKSGRSGLCIFQADAVHKGVLDPGKMVPGKKVWERNSAQGLPSI